MNLSEIMEYLKARLRVLGTEVLQYKDALRLKEAEKRTTEDLYSKMTRFISRENRLTNVVKADWEDLGKRSDAGIANFMATMLRKLDD